VLALQTAHSVSDLLQRDLARIGKREPLCPREKWLVGGPGLAGGADQVHATEEALEWSQKASGALEGWKKSYFALKGTSLFWFKAGEQGREPSGAINLNGLCAVNQPQVVSVTRKRKQCIEVSSPLLGPADAIVLSFVTERRCAQWLAELKAAIKRRADVFSSQAQSKGYKNSIAWVPVKELLDLRTEIEAEERAAKQDATSSKPDKLEE
jgi:hypothetical protein